MTTKKKPGPKPSNIQTTRVNLMIPDDLYTQIEKSAIANGRRPSQEIMFICRKALGGINE